MLCIPLNLLLSGHLGLEHAGELNDVGCEAVCVCACVCTWWNQPQVSTFLLLGFISFAFFSRADCWLSALISACSLNTQFFSPHVRALLRKSAYCPPVLQIPPTPLLPSKEWYLPLLSAQN